MQNFFILLCFLFLLLFLQICDAFPLPGHCIHDYYNCHKGRDWRRPPREAHSAANNQHGEHTLIMTIMMSFVVKFLI